MTPAERAAVIEATTRAYARLTDAQWASLTDSTKDYCRRMAVDILTAAEPLLAAHYRREALGWAWRDSHGPDGEPDADTYVAVGLAALAKGE